MEEALRRIKKKKLILDALRPFALVVQKNIDDWLRIELTYNSNAIEGNTLSRIETLLLVEQGITAKGKSLIEHQEAINHAAAFDYIIACTQQSKQPALSEVVFKIHSLILDKIDDTYKGRYRNVPVRIKGSMVILPNHVTIPKAMEEFYKNIAKYKNFSVPEQVSMAHYDLVRIHPFIDGNGRTARLFMNYLLLKNGFAPALIKKEERAAYLESLEVYGVSGSSEKYFLYMYKTIERGLDEYLKLLKGPVTEKRRLLKIGELAARTGISIPTVRYWTKEGLLSVQDYSPGGYQLYSQDMISLVGKIRTLQTEGYRLDMIKSKLNEIK